MYGSRFLLVSLLLACSAEPPSPTPPPGATATYSAALGDGPDFSRPASRITVDWWLDQGDASLFGRLADGAPLRFHTEAERNGNCRLVTYETSLCTPGCTNGDACIDGTCIAYPTREEAGTLTWEWPDGTLDIEPDGLSDYRATAAASSAGTSTLRLDDRTLTVPTVRPVQESNDWNDALLQRSAGEDVTLRWSNPEVGGRVRVHMTDCTGSHGGLAEAEIECEGPDSGSILLPGGFLDRLAAGAWNRGECGTQQFERYHSDADSDSDELRVESRAHSRFFWRPE